MANPNMKFCKQETSSKFLERKRGKKKSKRARSGIMRMGKPRVRYAYGIDIDFKNTFLQESSQIIKILGKML